MASPRPAPMPTPQALQGLGGDGTGKKGRELGIGRHIAKCHAMPVHDRCMLPSHLYYGGRRVGRVRTYSPSDHIYPLISPLCEVAGENMGWNMRCRGARHPMRGIFHYRHA
ncbi:hypothetical protein BGC30_08775 [Novacetimonas hansenii]|nr:hypothetical protein BGC30_08775 [Novacetimonas hansenii]